MLFLSHGRILRRGYRLLRAITARIRSRISSSRGAESRWLRKEVRWERDGSPDGGDRPPEYYLRRQPRAGAGDLCVDPLDMSCGGHRAIPEHPGEAGNGIHPALLGAVSCGTSSPGHAQHTTAFLRRLSQNFLNCCVAASDREFLAVSCSSASWSLAGFSCWSSWRPRLRHGLLRPRPDARPFLLVRFLFGVALGILGSSSRFGPRPCAHCPSGVVTPVRRRFTRWRHFPLDAGGFEVLPPSHVFGGCVRCEGGATPGQTLPLASSCARCTS